MVHALREQPSIAYRHPLTPYVTNFTVLIVDGNGTEVAGEQVTLSFLDAKHRTSTVQTRTDAAGRTRIVQTHDVEPVAVVVEAAGESTGELRPQPGAIVTIET